MGNAYSDDETSRRRVERPPSQERPQSHGSATVQRRNHHGHPQGHPHPGHPQGNPHGHPQGHPQGHTQSQHHHGRPNSGIPNGDPPRVPPQHGGPDDHSPTGTFARGGRLRSSLPIVRSPNKTMDRPLGLIFLTFRNETKRALLPNEVTSLDTVKALFVRSFCDTLSMQWFEIAGHKVYILDPNTNVFYELEDIRDVKDRSVLKVYEPDHPHGPPPSPGPHSPHTPDYLTLGGGHCHHGGTSSAPPGAQPPGGGYDSDTSGRSSSGTGVRSPLHHPPLSPRLYGQGPTKSGPHPAHPPHSQNTYACPQQVKASASANSTYGTASSTYGSNSTATYNSATATYAQVPTHHTPAAHWSPTSHRSSQSQAVPAPLSGSQFLHPSHSNQSSPQRGSQRHSVAYIPDNTIYQDARSLPQSRSYHDYNDGTTGHASGTATPTQATDKQSKVRMDQMEAQLANLAAWVQTTVMKTQSESGSRPGSARSNSSVVSEGSYSTKSKSDSTTPQQSPTASSSQGMSDISSATPQPMVSVDMQTSLRRLHQQAKDLRGDVNKLRRLQVTNMETVRDAIHHTYTQIKEVIATTPGAHSQPLRSRRCHVDTQVGGFRAEADRVQKDLTDLETSVEELRNDVLQRKCRINMTEIENMALALSTITKALGDLKAHFPALQGDMKSVMQGEMEVVVQEERMLREEPERLDFGLKRCKKLTGTLATMRRLGLVQEHKAPSAPEMTPSSPGDQDRGAVLDSIKAVIPDHEARYSRVKAAEESRERKKKIDTKGESLRFEKSLAMAQKQLKETSPAIPPPPTAPPPPLAPPPPPAPPPPITKAPATTVATPTSTDDSCLLSPIGPTLSPPNTSTPKSHAPELARKVPPPPPPRHSSHNISDRLVRPGSPHMYENIDKLRSDSGDHSETTTPDEAPSSSSSTASLDSQLGGGTGTIRRNKNYVGDCVAAFSDAAAATAAVTTATNGVTVSNSTTVVTAKTTAVTTSSKTTSIPTLASNNTSIPSPASNNNNVSNLSSFSTATLEQKAAKKIPPPPPQRKTSTLTHHATGTPKPDDKPQKVEKLPAVENQKIPTKCRSGPQEKTYKYRVGHNGAPPSAVNNKLLPNGDVPKPAANNKGSPAAVVGPRGFEETDIY